MPSEIVSFAGDFGDGTSGTGETARHTYDGAGGYIVTLTVTDDEVATAVATEVVDLVVAKVPRIASFFASPPVIRRGESAVLSWSATVPSPLSQLLDPGNIVVTGSQLSVAPVVTAPYTLTASNAGGTTSATAMVRVLQWPQQGEFGGTNDVVHLGWVAEVFVVMVRPMWLRACSAGCPA